MVAIFVEAFAVASLLIESVGIEAVAVEAVAVKAVNIKTVFVEAIFIKAKIAVAACSQGDFHVGFSGKRRWRVGDFVEIAEALVNILKCRLKLLF